MVNWDALKIQFLQKSEMDCNDKECKKTQTQIKMKMKIVCYVHILFVYVLTAYGCT